MRRENTTRRRRPHQHTATAITVTIILCHSIYTSLLCADQSTCSLPSRALSITAIHCSVAIHSDNHPPPRARENREKKSRIRAMKTFSLGCGCLLRSRCSNSRRD